MKYIKKYNEDIDWDFDDEDIIPFFKQDIVTDNTFKKIVLDSKIPVIVNLGAEWCGPCKFIDPIIDEIGKEYNGKATFVKLDVDYNPITVKQFKINNIPIILFFKNGQVVDQQIGAASKSKIVYKLKIIL